MRPRSPNDNVVTCFAVPNRHERDHVSGSTANQQGGKGKEGRRGKRLGRALSTICPTRGCRSLRRKASRIRQRSMQTLTMTQGARNPVCSRVCAPLGWSWSWSFLCAPVNLHRNRCPPPGPSHPQATGSSHKVSRSCLRLTVGLPAWLQDPLRLHIGNRLPLARQGSARLPSAFGGWFGADGVQRHHPVREACFSSALGAAQRQPTDFEQMTEASLSNAMSCHAGPASLFSFMPPGYGFHIITRRSGVESARRGVCKTLWIGVPSTPSRRVFPPFALDVHTDNILCPIEVAELAVPKSDPDRDRASDIGSHHDSTLCALRSAVFQTLQHPRDQELHPLRQHAQPTPELGHGDRVALAAGKAALNIAHALLQLLAPAQHGALRTSPRADAAAANARVEVALALGIRQTLDAALDAHLALLLAPPERQAGVRVRGDVGGLAAGAPVRVDDEAAARVQLLEVHDARRHAARGQRCGRQAHGFGLRDAVGLGAREPLRELLGGRGGEVVGGEGAFGELLGLRGGDCCCAGCGWIAGLAREAKSGLTGVFAVRHGERTSRRKAAFDDQPSEHEAQTLCTTDLRSRPVVSCKSSKLCRWT
ncbi:hypothetical protein FH972_026602 [Carpinus fangiana]|uniref:Uncharacterized protein n=1 Tax=Carpinus fangiana TaxID=176857 RepID=A0A5N6L4K8_9ROSI|nr:hypothetical protein FH972_026602 [Carpinus fangiana]